jgi:hypothetical protein
MSAIKILILIVLGVVCNSQLIGKLSSKDIVMSDFLKSLKTYVTNNLSSDSVKFQFMPYNSSNLQIKNTKVELISLTVDCLVKNSFGGVVNSFIGDTGCLNINLISDLTFQGKTSSVKTAVASNGLIITQYYNNSHKINISNLEVNLLVTNDDYNKVFHNLPSDVQLTFKNYLKIQLNSEISNNLITNINSYLSSDKLLKVTLNTISKHNIYFNFNLDSQPNVWNTNFLSSHISGQSMDVFPKPPKGFNEYNYIDGSTVQYILDKTLIETIINVYIRESNTSNVRSKSILTTDQVKDCSPDLYAKFPNKSFDLKCSVYPIILNNTVDKIDGIANLECDFSINDGLFNYFVYRIHDVSISYELAIDYKAELFHSYINFKLVNLQFKRFGRVDSVYTSDERCLFMLGPDVITNVSKQMNVLLLKDGIDFYDLVPSPRIKIFSTGILIYSPITYEISSLNNNHYDQSN